MHWEEVASAVAADLAVAVASAAAHPVEGADPVGMQVDDDRVRKAKRTSRIPTRLDAECDAALRRTVRGRLLYEVCPVFVRP